jgi:hypothetical protein
MFSEVNKDAKEDEVSEQESSEEGELPVLFGLFFPNVLNNPHGKPFHVSQIREMTGRKWDTLLEAFRREYDWINREEIRQPMSLDVLAQEKALGPFIKEGFRELWVLAAEPRRQHRFVFFYILTDAYP